VIPCLLKRGGGLVKSVRFRNHRYVGDPMNAIKIFNEKEVDELIVLDIDASRKERPIDWDGLRRMAEECFMPLCYGGGVRSVKDAVALVGLGVEKVALNSAALRDPDLLPALADRLGSQSVVAAIDVKKTWWGGERVYDHVTGRATGFSAVEHAQRMVERGAGEILLTSVDRDGTGRGYDLGLVERVARAVSVPVIACGGAGGVADLAAAVNRGGASAVAAGSLFVFHGPHRAVLINYPEYRELEKVLS